MKKTLLNLLAVGLTSMAFVGGLSAQDYPLSDAAKSNHRGSPAPRVVQKLVVTGATINEQPKEFQTLVAGEGATSQDKIYYDNTSNVLDVTKGDNLLLTAFSHQLEWMHYVVFVDWNQNKQFDEDEVVTYNAFEKDGQWVNSKGETVNNNPLKDKTEFTLPDFVVPETALKGETRVRFICQWNNTNDSKGNPSIGDNSGTVCDFTINVHEKGEVVVEKETLKNPTVTPEAGKYNNQVEVTISHEREGVELHYTTDGTNPKVTSPLYDGVLTFTKNTILKVIAIKDGFKPSEIITIDYKVRDPNKYEVWDEVNYPRPRTDRVVRKIAVEGATFENEAVDFTTIVAGEAAEQQTKIVFDNTEGEALNASLGDELTFKVFSYSLVWSHYYIFVDWNQNKEFEEGELMTFSAFTEDDGATWLNSAGEATSGNPLPEGEELGPNNTIKFTMPKFVIPEDAKLGKTRVRFLCQWNSKNPNGHPGPKDRFDQNGGTMCDFTIDIHKAPDKKSFAVKYTAEEEGGTVTLKKEDGTVVTPDTEVEEGTKLTLEVKAKEGKTIEKVTINSVEKELENGKLELTVAEALDIKVTYGVEKKNFAVKYTAEEEGGTVTLKKEDGTVVTPDTEVEEGTKLTLEVKAKEGKTIEKVTVNGVEKELNDGKLELTVSEALDIKVTYGTAAGINEVETDFVKVYKQAGTIIIEGAKLNAKVLVYNTQGVLVDAFKITSNQTQGKAQLHTGLYLVKLGTKTYKVML